MTHEAFGNRHRLLTSVHTGASRGNQRVERVSGVACVIDSAAPGLL
jgi:hypothetical protein